MLCSQSAALQRVCRTRELPIGAQQLSNYQGKDCCCRRRHLKHEGPRDSCCVLPKSSRGSPAAVGQAIGIHEGPRDVALQADGSYPMPSIVPHMEGPGQTPFSAKGEIIYSKGAAVLHMLEAYWNAAREGAFRVSCCLWG